MHAMVSEMTLPCPLTVFATLPTARCVEALARAGEYEKPLLAKAIRMFEVSALETTFSGRNVEFPHHRTSCNTPTT